MKRRIVIVIALAFAIGCSASSEGGTTSTDAGTHSPADTGADAQGAETAALDETGGGLEIDSGSASAEAGTASPYATPCSKTTECTGTSLLCKAFTLGAPGYDSYSCTETCTTTADCAASPPGTAPVSCLPFTTANYCMLMCKSGGESWDCPSPLHCIQPGGSSLGYCGSL